MLKLKNSGYNFKFRKEVLDSEIKAFQKMKDDDQNDIKPMYRSRDWNAEERQISKSKKKSNWWNNSKSEIQYKSVLFVATTPGGALAKQLRQREAELNKNNKERIKIVEKGGLKIKDILGSKKTFQKSKCIQKNCPLCTSSQFIETSDEETKIPCNTNNIGYEWTCLTCKEKNILKVYAGETGRSARIRARSMSKTWKGKNQKACCSNIK